MTADLDPKDHRVLVDCDNHVRMVNLLQYEQSTTPEVNIAALTFIVQGVSADDDDSCGSGL